MADAKKSTLDADLDPDLSQDPNDPTRLQLKNTLPATQPVVTQPDSMPVVASDGGSAGADDNYRTAVKDDTQQGGVPVLALPIDQGPFGQQPVNPVDFTPPAVGGTPDQPTPDVSRFTPPTQPMDTTPGVLNPAPDRTGDAGPQIADLRPTDAGGGTNVAPVNDGITRAPDNSAIVTTQQDDRMGRLAAANTPGMTPFSEEDNLVGTEISPTDSQRLTDRSAAVDAQNKTISGLDRRTAAAGYAGQSINPEESDRFARLRKLEDEQLARVTALPDRFSMAKDKFSQFEKDTAPEYDLSRKKALNDAATYGYTGSGRLNTQYGDLDLARERDLDSQRSHLFSDALDRSYGDNTSLVNTLDTLSGNEDSLQARRRDEKRKERDWTYDQGDQDISNEFKKGDYLTNAEADQRKTEGNTRDELRGERTYQRSAAERAVADRMDAARLSDQLTQSEFERNRERALMGYADDPSGEYANAATGSEAEGNSSATNMAEILKYLALQRRAGAQPTTAGG
jgi:hypothetical protein